MSFSFFCAFADGTQNAIDTHNLFEAKRRALNIGAAKLFVKNPGTNAISEISFK